MKNLLKKLHAISGITVEKDKKNPHFGNMYASLDGIVNTLSPILKEAGLVVTHEIIIPDNGTFLRTTVHEVESGEAVSSFFPIATTEPQKVWSTLTYAKRYNLSALFNIVSDEDDDAELGQTVPQLKWIGNKEINDMMSKIKSWELSVHSWDEAVKLAREYYWVSKENAELIKKLFKEQNI